MQEGDASLNRLAEFTELTRADLVRATNEISALSFALDETSQLQMRNINSFGVYRPSTSTAGSGMSFWIWKAESSTSLCWATSRPRRDPLDAGVQEVIGLQNFRKLFSNPR